MRILENYVPLDIVNAVQTKKNQIVLHHSAGSDNASGVRNWFITDSRAKHQKVCSHYLIDSKGAIMQLMDERHWAFTLGLNKAITNRIEIEREAITIELLNWGWLTKNGSQWHSYMGEVKSITDNNVEELPKSWRGKRFFHKYTDEQVQACLELCKDISERMEISLIGWNSPLWYEQNQAALGKVNGIYTHASYRTDKTDLSPQSVFARIKP